MEAFPKPTLLESPFTHQRLVYDANDDDDASKLLDLNPESVSYRYLHQVGRNAPLSARAKRRPLEYGVGAGTIPRLLTFPESNILDDRRCHKLIVLDSFESRQSVA